MSDTRITVETWQAATAAAIVVFTWLFKFFREWISDRRERRESQARLQVLRDISATNHRIVIAQAVTNERLSTLAIAVTNSCKLPTESRR